MSRGSATDADPVLTLFSAGKGDPRSLYYLWEQQQWEAGKIDLTVDARQWQELDPVSRRPVADSIAWRRLRAEVATRALVPLVDLAPDEEQQVFLTTQLVDEARHLVFFDRVFGEVLGATGDKVEDRPGIVEDPSLRVLLTEVLPSSAGRFRDEGAGPAGLLVPIAVYHLVILGALGLTEQQALNAYLTGLDVLPGIRRGLELEAGAAHRHVAFGLGLVTGTDDEAAAASAVQQGLELSLRLARSALAAAGAAPAPYPGDGLTDAADGALQRWGDAVGLKLTVRS